MERSKKMLPITECRRRRREGEGGKKGTKKQEGREGGTPKDERHVGLCRQDFKNINFKYV